MTESVKTRRHWPHRLLAAGALTALLTTTASAAPAQPRGPSHLLQAVNVSLSPDGSVVGLSSTDIVKYAKTSAASSRAYDPQVYGPKLPVTVTLGYVLNGQSGTDLADLRGRSGTVEIDITVSDTTVHAENIVYQTTSGQTSQTYALVGAPITVVASAHLPNGSFSSVEAPAAGSQAQDGETNGVIQSSHGATSVQWQTILAPPSLSAVTTFRLVEQTKDFALPQIVLSAQPGLVTDPSTAELITGAFAGESGTNADVLLSVEEDTISLIGLVQGQLASASSQLDQVQSTLSGQASALGDNATQQLTTTNQTIQGDAQQLQQELGQFESDLGQTLQTETTDTKGGLSAAVQALVDYIGLANPATSRTPAPPSNCTVGDLNTGTAPSTLTGELQLVINQIQALTGASDQCQQALAASLNGTIGPADLTTCPSSPTALTCTLAETSAGLTQVADAIPLDLENAVATSYPTRQINTVDRDFSALKTALSSTSAVASGLSSLASSGSSTLAGDLQSLSGDLSELKADSVTLASNATATAGILSTEAADVAAAGGDEQSVARSVAAAMSDVNPVSTDASTLAGALGQIHDVASGELQASGATTLVEQAVQGLQADVTQLCTDATGAALADAGSLAAAVGGAACGVAAGQATCPSSTLTAATPLADLVACIVKDWTSVSTSTNPQTAGTGPAAILAALQNAVALLRTDLATSSGAAATASGALGTVDSDLAGVVSRLDTIETFVDATLGPAIDKASTDLASATTDLTSGSGSITTAITQVVDDVGALSTSTNNALSTDLDNLYLGIGTAPTTSTSTTSTCTGPAAASLVCGVTKAMGSDSAMVGQSASAITHNQIPGVAQADSNAQHGVDSLLNTLSAALATSAGTASSADAATLGNQVSQLNSNLAQSNASFDSSLTTAIQNLNAAVTAADNSNNTATQQLLGELTMVLTDLGSSAGGGVLGFISRSSSQTAASAGQVQAVQSSSQQFSNVRTQEVVNQDLATQQLKDGISYAQQLPAFATKQAAGSTHLTVFVFTLKTSS